MGCLAAIAEDLRQTVTDAVACTAAGTPAVSYVANGEVAWDSCCNGMVAVVPGRIYPTRQFPAEDITPESIYCGSLAVWDLSVVVLRCAPTLDNQGNPPSPEALQASAVEALDDAQAVFRALQCWCGNYSESAIIRDTAWVGPEGGCVGSITSLLVELPDE